MGYRRKTCSYCRGNHAILDCKKLKTDAEEAQKALSSWTDEDDKIALRASRLYWEYSWDRPTERYLMKPEFRTRLVNDYPDLFSKVEDIKLSITREEKNELCNSRYRTKTKYHGIIRQNAEVRAKEAKRASKSCSYCRGKGHTVRTCPQMKADRKTLEDWRLIDSYLKAKALSRAGIWTAAMLVVPKDPDHPNVKSLPSMAYTLQALRVQHMLSSYSVYKAFKKDKDTYRHDAIDMSEDELHETIVNGVLEHINFTAIGAETKSARYDGIGAWYMKYNHVAGLHIIDRYESPEGYKKPFFMRTHISFEHIFSQLIQRDLPELVVKDSWRRNAHGYIVSRFDEPSLTAGSQVSYRSGQMDFTDKKQRRVSDWNKIEAFVKENKSILNKAKKLNV